jgi:periplasmic divalent cation tolerance protein
VSGSGLVSVWITCAGADEAEKLGRALVEERLAACANVLPGVTSIYRWEGKLQRDAETGLLLKTRAELFPALEARVRALHGYEVPCIVGWPIEAASEPYARWVREQTGPL